MEVLKEKCCVCGGVIYKKAHFTAVEGDLIALIVSDKCVITVARCQMLGKSVNN